MEENTRKELENKFAKLLINAGFNFVSGVPCAAQKYIIDYLSNHPKIQHIPANRESEALGIATGAFLAGKKPIVYMQNSGLMNSLNDITSLLISYKIPILLIITWRGAPGEDAPQHLVNGRSMIKILDTIGIPAQILTKENMKLTIQFSKTWLKEKQIPAAILIIRGILK